MTKIIFTVTDEMHDDLEEIARKQGASLAGLIRLYLVERLAIETGKDTTGYRVEWGGKRSSVDDVKSEAP